MKDAVVVGTGVANVASVLASLRRLGLMPRLSERPQEILSADIVVLPGVGAFGAGIHALESSGFADALRRRVEKDLPTLAICLGMQLLFEESEESPGARGLGIFVGKIKRFRQASKIPQIGWNTIAVDESCRSLAPGPVYFANSYHLDQPPSGASAATCDYAEKFTAAFEKSNLLACQFHPELSGALGEGIVRAWLDNSGMRTN